MHPNDTRIGKRLSVHPVDSWGRWTDGLFGVVLLVLGVSGATALLAIPHWGQTRGVGHSPAAWLFSLSIIGIGLGIGLVVVKFPRAVRGGWREVFEVHKQGIAHRGWRVRGWRWDELTTIRQWKPNSCAVRFSDGTRLRIDKDVLDYQRLITTLVTRRPDAIDTTPPCWYRHAPTLLWSAFVLFLCSGIGLGWYVTANLNELVGNNRKLLIGGAGASVFGLLAVIVLLGLWTMRQRRYM